MKDTSLQARIRTVRRRWLTIGSASALFWGLAAAVGLLLAAAWLDLLWELSPAWRTAMPCAAAVLGAVWVAGLVRSAVCAGRSAALARRLDQTARSGGQILTGLELSWWGRPDPQPSSVPHGTPITDDVRAGENVARDKPAADLSGPPREVSQSAPSVLGRLSPVQASVVRAGLARVAVDRAAAVAGRVPVAKAVPAKPLGRAGGSLTLLLAATALLALCMPGLARTQWRRFTDPFGDVPPFSPTRFEVTPGDVDVLYGNPLEIHAAVIGPSVEQLELVLENDDQPQEVLPMFPDPDGHWRAALARVTAPAVYHVRAYRARSEKHRIGVITVPRIENVRLRITPPAYTNLAPYEGPLPKEGVVGLPGTKVRIWARSNRPLAGGTLTVTGEAGPAEYLMKPSSGDREEVVGQFEIGSDGKFVLHVIDVAGQASQESFGGTVTLLPDEHPFIRLLEPRARSLATPNVALPVVLSAEDDYGVSRVQLYRSLNGSRPLPTDVPIATQPPRRVYEQVYLPLGEYGLQPGDVIKLFGRVEDNDPGGPKGSESSVVTVQIISQEEFERLLRVRQGLEVLMSKYRQAQRRMESLAEAIEGLRKELKDRPPQSAVAEETRQRLQRLMRRMRDESEALRKLSKNRLPYDIDKNLGPQLETVARIPEEMAEELEKLLKQKDLHHDALARQLKKLAERLASGRSEFDQNATQPLEQLEAVFPLMADQSRFVMIVLRQMDLAERLASLKGRDGEDNPELKTRMRDLEQEQQQIREDLTELLGDIEDHVQRLPDESQFDKLRETALKFADDVGASGASEAMAEAEAGLAEFSGTRGHQEAQQAAEILKKFLKFCEGGGMCAAAEGCLIFQPSLSKSLGNTAAQLLAEMGLGTGTGSGPGIGSGTGGTGGYSARRGGFGLYGGLPGMTGAPSTEYGEGRDAETEPYSNVTWTRGGGDNPDQPTRIDSPAAASAGISDGAIPPRYRRRVGLYFQRIAEEVGQE